MQTHYPENGNNVAATCRAVDLPRRVVARVITDNIVHMKHCSHIEKV